MISKCSDFSGQTGFLNFHKEEIKEENAKYSKPEMTLHLRNQSTNPLFNHLAAATGGRTIVIER